MVESIKSPRSKILGGITVKVETSCGNMYVQMNWSQGRLFEVFATLGHSGSCASCEIEALTRSITLGLRCNVPCGEYAKELRGIQCPNPHPFPRETAVMSCPDAIGKAIAEFGEMSPRQLIRLLRNSVPSKVQTESDEEAQARVVMRQLAEEREKEGLND